MTDTDELIDADEVVEQAKERIVAPDDDYPLGADLELTLEGIDLETGLVTLSAQTPDQHPFTIDRFLPELFGWDNPDAAIQTTQVDHDVAHEAGQPLKDAVAEQEDVEPGDVYIQSITAPTEVEYALSSPDGGIITDYDE